MSIETQSIGEQGTHGGRTAPDEGRYVVSRTIPATPKEVFALLTDPSRHPETEPTDWVRGSLEEHPAPLTEVGQVFGIEMFHENAHGRYDMHNRVIAFEQDRTIAWEPGQYGPDGELGTGGWTWRYDLAPAGGAGGGAGGAGSEASGADSGASGADSGVVGADTDTDTSTSTSTSTSTGTGTGTEVTLTYDWSAVPAPLQEEFGLPPFPPSFLEESLAALERGVTGK